MNGATLFFVIPYRLPLLPRRAHNRRSKNSSSPIHAAASLRSIQDFDFSLQREVNHELGIK